MCVEISKVRCKDVKNVDIKYEKYGPFYDSISSKFSFFAGKYLYFDGIEEHAPNYHTK